MTNRLMIVLLATATALTPIAASAQNGGFGERVVREARGEHRGGEHRGNGEGRARHERRAPDAQPQPQPQYQPHADPQPRYERPHRTEPRQDNGGVQWNPRSDDSNARHDRGSPGVPVEQGRWQDRRRGDGGDTNNQNRFRRRGDGGGFGRDVIRDARRGGGDDARYDHGNWDRTRHDRDARYDRHDNRGDTSRYDRSRGYGYGRGYDGNQRYGRHDRSDNGHRWDRNWRMDRRYDWFDHRSRYRNQYSWGHYYSPYRNWDYRRISIGFSLWPLFYSDQYWINDPWAYRLPEAYGPYRWVRYYDDALLVDVRTGEVVDVIDNFFW